MIARGGLPRGADQFNSLHEKLIARWREMALGRFLHLRAFPLC
jgi:glutathionylspermidine synthase